MLFTNRLRQKRFVPKICRDESAFRIVWAGLNVAEDKTDSWIDRERFGQFAQPVRRHLAVIVQEPDDLALSQVDPGIPRSRRATRRGPDVTQVGRIKVWVQGLRSRVVVALIDDDHLERAIVVQEQRLNRLRNAVTPIAGRHNDADEWR